MKKEKSHLRVRENLLRRMMAKINVEKEKYDDPEDFENIIEIVQAGIGDLKTFLDSVEDEIVKINWGLEQLDSLEESEAKNILRTYIEKDTTLSVKNFSTARKDYDLIIESTKKLKDIFEENNFNE